MARFLPVLLVHLLCEFVVSVPVDNSTSTDIITKENSGTTQGNSTLGQETVNNTSSTPDEGPIDYYTTKYDHVDVETILNNRRMVKYYARCLLGEGPCPPDGAEFKRILPDAIRTNCRRCTEKQKFVTLHAIKRLMKEYPKIWESLQNAWDPDDIYVKKLLSTYSTWIYKPPVKVPIFNRFDDDETTQSSFNLPELPPIPPKVLDTVEPYANQLGAGITATIKLVKGFEKQLWDVAKYKFRLMSKLFGG